MRGQGRRPAIRSSSSYRRSGGVGPCRSLLRCTIRGPRGDKGGVPPGYTVCGGRPAPGGAGLFSTKGKAPPTPLRAGGADYEVAGLKARFYDAAHLAGERGKAPLHTHNHRSRPCWKMNGGQTTMSKAAPVSAFMRCTSADARARPSPRNPFIFQLPAIRGRRAMSVSTAVQCSRAPGGQGGVSPATVCGGRPRGPRARRRRFV